MTITMYDLAGVEADRRFSPFCWRTRMALAHKRLDVTTVPWRFTEKDKLPSPNDGRVPVIVDGGRVVHDSSVIAEYLDEHYSDRPVCSTGAAKDLTKFVQGGPRPYCRPGSCASWCSISGSISARPTRLFSPIARGAVRRDAGGCGQDRAARPAGPPGSLDPLRRTVERQDFVCGAAPAYADYIVFGAFQWARSISDFELLAADDPIYAWRGRMLDLFDGLARKAPGYGG